MCGIAGIVGQVNIDYYKPLKLMLDCQAHRGPDAEGMHFESMNDYAVALGHRRLSIIDIAEHANQPMHFEHLSISYNGEVYNYNEIKIELLHEGYRFATASDTEVILKAFHKWGISALHKFRGMFAFCIFDKKINKVYLIRDRVGVKPLYYYLHENTLIFSSEIASFYHYPHFTKKISQYGLSLYLQYGYIKAPWTIYQDTHKVSPGHYIEYDITKHKLQTHKYWDLENFYQLPKLNIHEIDAVNQLEQLLIDSFSLRMIADVPVGVLLSGGIDSTLVTAITQGQSTQAINTFTMAFENNQYDESNYARKIAHLLGTKHHEHVCTWQDAQSIIYDLPTIYNEPFADSSAIPTTLIAKFVKRNVSVLLSGDGGDELFCGYPSYQINNNRFNYINKIPYKPQLEKLLNYIADPLVKLLIRNPDLTSKYFKLKSVLTGNCIEDQYNSITRVFSIYDLKQLFNNDIDIFASVNIISKKLDTLESMMLIDFKGYLPDDLLVKVDRATMHSSIEGREPLLDHTLLEFAAQLPLSLKNNKSILKKVLNKYLPSEYFERKKHGFGVPINMWLRTELRYLIEQYLCPQKLLQQKLFNAKYVAQLVRYFFNSQTNDHKIWTLLMFQMWYEKHLDGIF